MAGAQQSLWNWSILSDLKLDPPPPLRTGLGPLQPHSRVWSLYIHFSKDPIVPIIVTANN